MAFAAFQYINGRPMGSGPLSVPEPQNKEQFNAQHPFAPGGWDAQLPSAPATNSPVGAQQSVSPVAAMPKLPMYNPLMPPDMQADQASQPAGQAYQGMLENAQQQAKAEQVQMFLRDRGLDNIGAIQDPNQAALAAKAAQVAFEKFNSGSQSTSSVNGMAVGVPVKSYAFSDVRNNALAAGGAPVQGVGGALVSAQAAPSSAGLPVYQQNALPGNRFTLTQNPNTVPGAPGYVAAPPQVAPKAVAAFAPQGPSQAAMQFLQTGVAPNIAAPTPPPAAPAQPQSSPAQQSAWDRARNARLGVYTAPDGSMFARDPMTGHMQPIGVNPDLAAQAKAKEAGATEQATQEVKEAADYLKGVHDNAVDAGRTMADVQNLKNLYAQGASSGFGQENLTTFRQALAAAHLSVDPKLPAQEQFQKGLNALALKANQDFLKGFGRITQGEVGLVGKAVANIGLTPEANMKILDTVNHYAQQKLELENYSRQLADNNVPYAKRMQLVRAREDDLARSYVDTVKAMGQAAKATPEIRYDASGKAWTKNDKGEVVPYGG